MSTTNRLNKKRTNVQAELASVDTNSTKRPMTRTHARSLKRVTRSSGVISKPVSLSLSTTSLTQPTTTTKKKLSPLVKAQRKVKAKAILAKKLAKKEKLKLQRRPKPSIVNLPAHWDADPTKSMLIQLKRKNPNHAKEYAEVAKRFKSTSKGAQSPVTYRPVGLSIRRIERIQNRVVYRAYAKKKAALLKSKPSQRVDVKVFHGSRGNSPTQIARSGMDVKFGGYGR